MDVKSTNLLRRRLTLLPRTTLHIRLLPRSVPLILRRRVKHIEMLLAARPNLEDAGHVATAVTVIRCGPYSRETVVVQD